MVASLFCQPPVDLNKHIIHLEGFFCFGWELRSGG